ncbi:hypothetical protein PAMA_013731 [Pampus argenteus]
MMGCTPKGIRIPWRQRYECNDEWEEVDHKKHQPARKAILKENPPVPPRVNARTRSTAPTAAVNQEYETPAISHPSTSVQVNISIREHPAVRPKHSQATVTEEPYTTPSPPKVVRPKTKQRNDQTSSQTLSSSFKVNESIRDQPAVRPKNSQATVTEESHTLSQQFFQRVTNSTTRYELQDFSSGVQVNRSVSKSPTTPSPPRVVRPKTKQRNDQTSSQTLSSSFKVNESIRERQLTVNPKPTVKDRKDQTLSQIRQEISKSELELKIQIREERMQKTTAVRVRESAPDSTSTGTQTDVKIKEDPKSCR